jgi:hypothetical protein
VVTPGELGVALGGGVGGGERGDGAAGAGRRGWRSRRRWRRPRSCGGATAWTWTQLERHPIAVVTATAPVRPVPDPLAKGERDLPPGAEVRVVREWGAVHARRGRARARGLGRGGRAAAGLVAPPAPTVSYRSTSTPGGYRLGTGDRAVRLHAVRELVHVGVDGQVEQRLRAPPARARTGARCGAAGRRACCRPRPRPTRSRSPRTRGRRAGAPRSRAPGCPGRPAGTTPRRGRAVRAPSSMAYAATRLRSGRVGPGW